MLTIRYTSRFKKDYKAIKKRGYNYKLQSIKFMDSFLLHWSGQKEGSYTTKKHMYTQFRIGSL